MPDAYFEWSATVVVGYSTPWRSARFDFGSGQEVWEEVRAGRRAEFPSGCQLRLQGDRLELAQGSAKFSTNAKPLLVDIRRLVDSYTR